MSQILSLLEYSPYHSGLRNYGNILVSSVIRALPSGHINPVHVKLVVCVFCGFSVAKERSKRMEIHLRAPTTNFPAPEIVAATENTCTTSDNVT